METKNILTGLSNDRVSLKYENAYSDFYATPYPIHPIAFEIEDQGHLAQISNFANSFINFLKQETNNIKDCCSYIIEDVTELNLTRHAFTLKINCSDPDSRTALNKAVQDFIESDEDWLYNTFTCHIINNGDEDDQDLYAFITMYIYY